MKKSDTLLNEVEKTFSTHDNKGRGKVTVTAKRQCARCKKEESGETIIAKGRLSKDLQGFFPEWVCNNCVGEEKVYPARFLLEIVQQKNEARREVFEVFEKRKEVWKRVASGKSEPPLDKENPSHFAVIGARIIGIEKIDAAAILKSGVDIKCFTDRQKAEEFLEKDKQKKKLFDERKESWQTIAKSGGALSTINKKEGDCAHPHCNRKAGEGFGVVGGEVIELCEFCAAALFAAKKDGNCRNLVFFRGKDATERVKRHLQWLRTSKTPKRKGLCHRPFEVLNGGKNNP